MLKDHAVSQIQSKSLSPWTQLLLSYIRAFKTCSYNESSGCIASIKYEDREVLASFRAN